MLGKKVKLWIDSITPIFVKDLRQGLRAQQFVWPFIVVQLGAIGSLIIEYIGGTNGAGNFNGSNPFAFYLYLGCVFAIVLPLTNFGSLHSEIAVGRNIELLLMSGLTRWQIVLGKWFVANCLALLLLISLLPYWIARYTSGSVASLSTEMAALIAVVALNWMMNAVVIGHSSFQSHVVKIFMMLLAGFLAMICVQVQFFFLGALGNYSYGSNGVVMLGLALLGLLAPFAVALLNLQVGRAKLKLFEKPTEASTALAVIILIIIAPLIIGTCFGPIGAAVLILIAVRIE